MWVVVHCFRSEGKILFSCSVDGQVVLWSSCNQPYSTVQVSTSDSKSHFDPIRTMYVLYIIIL